MDSMKDLNDAVGSDEEAEAVIRKRERKESAFASRRFEKDEPAAKSKKKPRVLVEVMASYIFSLETFSWFSIVFSLLLLEKH